MDKKEPDRGLHQRRMTTIEKKHKAIILMLAVCILLEVGTAYIFLASASNTTTNQTIPRQQLSIEKQPMPENSISMHTIRNNSVLINDSKVTIEASPYTTDKSGYVNLNLLSKNWSGNINIVFGFDSDSALPKSLDLYNPHNIPIQHSFTCDGPGTFYNTSGKTFYCWQNGTAANATANATNTTLILSHGFETANATTKTAYWTENKTEEWQSIAYMFSRTDYNFDGKDRWFYATNIPITAGTTYTTRLWLDIRINEQGKYDAAFYPSSYGTNIQQAINDGNFYYLDPWFDTSYQYCRNINITAGFTQNNYNSYINILNTSNMTSGTYRIVNASCNNAGTAMQYLEESFATNNLSIWIKHSVTGGTQYNYSIYYGNTTSATNGSDNTTVPIWAEFDNAAQLNLLGNSTSGGCKIAVNPTGSNATLSGQTALADYCMIWYNLTNTSDIWTVKTRVTPTGIYTGSDWETYLLQMRNTNATPTGEGGTTFYKGNFAVLEQQSGATVTSTERDNISGVFEYWSGTAWQTTEVHALANSANYNGWITFWDTRNTTHNKFNATVDGNGQSTLVVDTIKSAERYGDRRWMIIGDVLTQYRSANFAVDYVKIIAGFNGADTTVIDIQQSQPTTNPYNLTIDSPLNQTYSGPNATYNMSLNITTNLGGKTLDRIWYTLSTSQQSQISARPDIVWNDTGTTGSYFNITDNAYNDTTTWIRLGYGSTGPNRYIYANYTINGTGTLYYTVQEVGGSFGEAINIYNWTSGYFDSTSITSTPGTYTKELSTANGYINITTNRTYIRFNGGPGGGRLNISDTYTSFLNTTTTNVTITGNTTLNVSTGWQNLVVAMNFTDSTYNQTTVYFTYSQTAAGNCWTCTGTVLAIPPGCIFNSSTGNIFKVCS
jgi:hypothetical protein